MRSAIVTLLFLATAVPASAQPFANAKASLAGYSVANTMPAKTCESMSSFKGDGVTTIQAKLVPATPTTAQHCRIVGVIAPEVAFEVNLPDRWNRRFYMTGNGGLAGQAVDAPNNADRAAGLSNGGRRRAPGLRREEVAHLTGMSVDYYARLEQGRERNPSSAIVG